MYSKGALRDEVEEENDLQSGEEGHDERGENVDLAPAGKTDARSEKREEMRRGNIHELECVDEFHSFRTINTTNMTNKLIKINTDFSRRQNVLLDGDKFITLFSHSQFT